MMEVATPVDSHANAAESWPDRLLSLLSDAATYIGNIGAVSGLEKASKESLDNDFQTINGLLTDAVAKGITVEDADRLEISESPIRSVNFVWDSNWGVISAL